jgi:hypothetical protein
MHTYMGSIANNSTGMRTKSTVEDEISTNISGRVGQALWGPSIREHLRRV